jgi:hypothetical protein
MTTPEIRERLLRLRKKKGGLPKMRVKKKSLPGKNTA